MEELLQEMRENIQILMETAEVLENQIARLKALDAKEASRFLSAFEHDLNQRNISVEPTKEMQTRQETVKEEEAEKRPIHRKRSKKSKI